ncbi:macrosialin isoform X1 [Hemicordylus capensis]|uniref:macrosialin isoform X1 n=1 Tax=Hemicordylus capensis TaxID=884348 RepID=UPI0023030CC8|nr:macrosialin isoform X1 [Hemicordylus capensis]
MRPPWLAAWALPLGLAGCFLLAGCASSSAQDEELLPLSTEEPGLLGPHAPCSGSEPLGPACPHKKKAATLEPAFTKSTTPTTTHHRTTTHHNTTTHPPTTTHHRTTTHHNTTTHPPTTTHHRTTTHHTTMHPPTTKPHPTTPPHPTTKHPTPRNVTTHHPTTSHMTTRHPTTSATNHTTAHPPTPAPTPTQPPVIPSGNYVVGNGSATCLRVQSGLQIRVRYTDKTKKQRWGVFTVQPNRTAAAGNCSSHTATLDLRFPEGFLLFMFTKNETQTTVYLSRVQANLTYQFPQATETNFGAENASLREFQARLGHSYTCQNRSMALAPDFHLQALDERVQAFQLKAGEFGEAEDCKVPKRRSITVPLVIGLLLGILIIIVIVAYLVGRRRAQGGYQPL